jgi:hypothetical protein
MILLRIGSTIFALEHVTDVDFDSYDLHPNRGGDVAVALAGVAEDGGPRKLYFSGDEAAAVRAFFANPAEFVHRITAASIGLTVIDLMAATEPPADAI